MHILNVLIYLKIFPGVSPRADCSLTALIVSQSYTIRDESTIYTHTNKMCRWTKNDVI